METSVVEADAVSRVLIITSFAIVACVFANYSIYMLFCLKDKFRTIIK